MQSRKSPQRSFKRGYRHSQWLNDYPGDSRQSLVDSCRESWILTDVSVATFGVPRAPKTVTDKLQRVLNAAAPVWSVTHGSLIVAWRHSSTMSSLAGCAREGYLQEGCHDVPLSSWSGTSIPCRPFHHVLRRRFSALCAFCKPSPAVPRCRLNTYGRRAFLIASLELAVPDELRDPACGSDSFKQFLKTIVFSLY